jgi:hypothetical protein
MRFSNKRSSSSRKAPANAPSPVTEATEAVQSPGSKQKDSERAPAAPPKRVSETNVAPYVEPAASSRGPAKPESSTAAASRHETWVPVELPDELIAARAYELWQRRGCPMGHSSEEDWHAARAELERERLSFTTAQPEDRDKI